MRYFSKKGLTGGVWQADFILSPDNQKSSMTTRVGTYVVEAQNEVTRYVEILSSNGMPSGMRLVSL